MLENKLMVIGIGILITGAMYLAIAGFGAGFRGSQEKNATHSTSAAAPRPVFDH